MIVSINSSLNTETIVKIVVMPFVPRMSCTHSNAYASLREIRLMERDNRLLKETNVISSLNVMRDFDPSDFDLDFDIFFMRIGRSVRPARRQRIDHHNGKGEDSLICFTY